MRHYHSRLSSIFRLMAAWVRETSPRVDSRAAHSERMLFGRMAAGGRQSSRSDRGGEN